MVWYHTTKPYHLDERGAVMTACWFSAPLTDLPSSCHEPSLVWYVCVRQADDIRHHTSQKEEFFMSTSHPRISFCVATIFRVETERGHRGAPRFYLQKPRALCFLGKFSGRKDRECRPGNGCLSPGCLIVAATAFGPSPDAAGGKPSKQSYAGAFLGRNSTGITPGLHEIVILFGVHDPGWCWVQASNLWGLGGPVVRFNLAHGVEKCGVDIDHSLTNPFANPSVLLFPALKHMA